jgi:hypothetical protein
MFEMKGVTTLAKHIFSIDRLGLASCKPLFKLQSKLIFTLRNLHRLPDTPAKK